MGGRVEADNKYSQRVVDTRIGDFRLKLDLRLINEKAYQKLFEKWNITIGEIVIAVFAYLGSIAAPVTALPFTLLEIGVGALQAYIFTILGTMYLAIAVNSAQQHHLDEGDLTEGEVPERIRVSNVEPTTGRA